MSIDLEGERRAEHRQAVRVIGRAIERIEDPPETRRARLPGSTAQFLCEDVVMRKALREQRAAHLLALEIDFSDQVDRPLLVDLKAGLAAGHLDLTRPQHDLDCGGE